MRKLTTTKRWMSVIAVFALTILFVSSTIQPVFASDSILFDDQGKDYWSLYNGGTGNLTMTIATETTNVFTGQSSIKGAISAGQHETVGFYHRFNQTQDFSQYNSICFWLYGTKSNAWITFAILDATNNNIAKLIPDNFTGWYFFVLDLKNFEFRSSDSFNLSQIRMIEFAFSNPAPDHIYLDQLSLRTDVPQETSAPTPSPTPSPVNPTPTPAHTPSATPTPQPSSTPTPTASPTSAPTTTPKPSLPIYTPTPSPTEEPASEPLIIHVTNGTFPLTAGEVHIGASTSPIGASGDAIFNNIQLGISHHLWVVFDGFTIYNNESFPLVGGNYFQVNVGQISSGQTQEDTSVTWWLTLVVAVVIVVVVLVAIAVVLRRRK